MAVVNDSQYITHSAADDVSTGRKAVNMIIWQGATDAAHTLVVKDGNGNIKIPALLAMNITDPYILYFDPPLQMDGIETNVLGSGTVIYWLR